MSKAARLEFIQSAKAALEGAAPSEVATEAAVAVPAEAMETPTSEVAPVATEEATPEVPTEVPAEEPQQPEAIPDDDPRFMQVLSKLRELSTERDSLQRERDELSQLRTDAELAKRIREGDFRAAEELGLTLSKWSNSVLQGYTDKGDKGADPTTAELRALREKIQNLEREKEVAATQSQQAAMAQQLEDFKKSVYQEVDSNPEFQLLSVAGAHNMVYDEIAQHADRTALLGRAQLLPTKEAARRALKKLAPSLRKQLEVFRGLEDFKDLFGAAPAPKPAPREPTSVGGVSGGHDSEPGTRKLTRAELRAHALAVLDGRDERD